MKNQECKSTSLMGRGTLSSVFGKSNGLSNQLNAVMSGSSGFGRIHGMDNYPLGAQCKTKCYSFNTAMKKNWLEI